MKRNFDYLASRLGRYNKLNLIIPNGAFMYLMYIRNGESVRRKLQGNKVYILILGLELCKEDEVEYDMAKNILRYLVTNVMGTTWN